VPQDPNDESASILLERIKTERSAAQPAGGEKAEPSGGDMPVWPSSYLITLSHNSQFKGQRRVLMKPMG
jgi:hypothetical protein